jgi:hypothetical protein
MQEEKWSHLSPDSSTPPVTISINQSATEKIHAKTSLALSTIAGLNA